ncbi:MULTISPECIES: 50S ribosomal protein L29 [unclassified Persephonella]|uniref:50S ribosomal protein L29 n=1 Tax=unclassified Persephonella TaxID=2641955 RepID=UPI000498123D|nr:50S ribosomal protein L29 [Persephonella sp. KM09-Lau-8]
MKVEELRKLTDDELKEKLVELKKKLMNLRFQNSIGGLEKPSEIRETKRTIARILTILRERELQAQSGGK